MIMATVKVSDCDTMKDLPKWGGNGVVLSDENDYGPSLVIRGAGDKGQTICPLSGLREILNAGVDRNGQVTPPPTVKADGKVTLKFDRMSRKVFVMINTEKKDAANFKSMVETLIKGFYKIESWKSFMFEANASRKRSFDEDDTERIARERRAALLRETDGPMANHHLSNAQALPNELHTPLPSLAERVTLWLEDCKAALAEGKTVEIEGEST